MYELPRHLQRRHEINDLVEWHGIINVERLLEVHRTTIQRWCNGTVNVPIVAIIALRALKGDFPHMEAGKKWEGWRFGRDGILYEPNGTPRTEGEIRGLHWLNQIVAAQRQQIKELAARLDANNIPHGVVITANDTYEDPANHPVAKLLEENYQLKRDKRGRGRR